MAGRRAASAAVTRLPLAASGDLAPALTAARAWTPAIAWTVAPARTVGSAWTVAPVRSVAAAGMAMTAPSCTELRGAARAGNPSR